MLSARLIFLFGVVLLVDGKSVEHAEDYWDLDDVEDAVFRGFDEPSLRLRREVDEKEATGVENNSAEDRPRPERPGESGECMCPPPPPGPPGEQVRPHPCQGLSKAACRQKLAPPPYDGPPCELRLFFRLPTDFNHTARKECFEKWEKPALEEKGVDFSKPPPKILMRPHFHRTLLIHKGCDTQCMFLETKLVVEDSDSYKISKDAVMATLKEDDDPQELTDVFEEQIDKCIEEAGELVHAKQSCKSGADEFLACLRFNIGKTCPGAKWKGNKSCTEIEESNTKLRNCRREQRDIFIKYFRGGMKAFRHSF